MPRVPWCAAVSQRVDTTPLPQPRNLRGADWRLAGGRARSHRCGDPAPTGTPVRSNGCLPLFKYLQGLDEEAEPSVRFMQRSGSEEEEEEGRGRSRGRGLGLRVRWQCRCSWWF